MITVGEFLNSLSPRSRRTYLFAFKKVAERVGKNVEDLTVDDITLGIAREILKEIKNPYSANVFVSALRSYAKFVKVNYRPKDLNERLARDDFYDEMQQLQFLPTPEFSSGDSLTVDELRRLLDCIDDRKVYVATIMYFYTGARAVEIAREYEAKKINLKEPPVQPVAVVDVSKSVMVIPTAKRVLHYRVIPIDPIVDYAWEWANVSKEVARYAGGRSEVWYTTRIQRYAEKAGLKVTAKTARRTFDTIMSARMVEIISPNARDEDVGEWIIKYWMGHKGTISDKYRDYAKLIDLLRRTIVKHHYIHEVL